MALAQLLSFDFSKTVRDRGASYFRMGLVRIDQGSDDSVSATVYGGQRYKISLTWSGTDLSALCNCPFAKDEGPCKHIWATILAADAKGYLAAAHRNNLTRMTEYVGDLALEEEPPPPAPKPKTQLAKPWQSLLSRLRQDQRIPVLQEPWPSRRELLYVFPVYHQSGPGLTVELMTRDRKLRGPGYNKPKELRLMRSQIANLPGELDQRIVTLLGGAVQSHYYPLDVTLAASFGVDHLLASSVIPLIAQTGRCFLRTSYRNEMLVPVSWQGEVPIRLELEVEAARRGWEVRARLLQGEREIELSSVVHVSQTGYLFTTTAIFRLENPQLGNWIQEWHKAGALVIGNEDIGDFLTALIESPEAPRLVLPESLRYEELASPPRPALRITTTRDYNWQPEYLRGELSFDYDGRRVAETVRSRGIYVAGEKRLLLRDSVAENACTRRLVDLGMRFQKRAYAQTSAWHVSPSRLPSLVRALVEEGWSVEADGKAFRRPGRYSMEVASGIDWFELRGEVDYGGAKANLPALIAAMKKGDKMVRLDDGTFGMLPEQWLAKLGPLVAMGAGNRDHLRFHRNQAGLLDALLAAQPEASFDEGFRRVREQLRGFQGVTAAEQPAEFVGTLRDYQREGLGWMQFLSRFGFGGCLADDMGVGKTIQVLALLETRRLLRSSSGNGEGNKPALGPSLVVVPKSLVFNWKEEAARFTPKLKILDYTGLARSQDGFPRHDVVLTTYGTLRRDVLLFQNCEFDFVILDEAQAVKNAESESAKAVRLLKGRHRLALSGTPVENHLGELWSLFEFLNPGMLGSASVFKIAGGGLRNPDEETRRLLAHALRPFILRRTKEQVARELPDKTEQTIYCEMEPEQRKLYNDLRAYYRDSLLKRVDEQGLAKSKMHVLEALLRLRQAACHPGLLDESRGDEPSAKMEVLLARLNEVLEEGHKALVFSQFTSLLALIRERLDPLKIPYAYVDGKTRDRKAEVDRFQSDPNCPLFLLSLKAGGLGLNLTAAEYVFLLDPWWNPAVESQAIDRAHRIGQTRQVFAYRLIARETVEEKVLELQKTKRDLAAAIIGEDNRLIRDLKREDLELLLS